MPIPRYDDYQARATWSLRQDEELALTFLASDDHLRRAIPSDDPTEVRSQNTDARGSAFILRYTRLLPDGASVVVTPSFGYDTTDLSEQFGDIPVNLTTRTYQYGLRGSYRRRVAPTTTLSFGVDMQARSTTLDRLGSLTLPAREGDITVFGQPPRNLKAVDHWNALVIDTAPYITAEVVAGTAVAGPRPAVRARADRRQPCPARRRHHRPARLRQLLAAQQPSDRRRWR